MLSWFVLTDNFLISHLEVFDFRKLSSVNFLMEEICASSVVVEANMRMSSACRKPSTYILFTDAPLESDYICLNRGSITSKNGAGDRMGPLSHPSTQSKGRRYILTQAY